MQTGLWKLSRVSLKPDGINPKNSMFYSKNSIQTVSMFKKHLLLTRFLGYISLKWYVESELRFYATLWKNSGLWYKVLWVLQLFVKGDLW